MERKRTITAATGILIVVPGASDMAALLDDDEVARLVLPYHIDCGTHPYHTHQSTVLGLQLSSLSRGESLTRDACSDNHDSRIGVCVPARHVVLFWAISRTCSSQRVLHLRRHEGIQDLISIHFGKYFKYMASNPASLPAGLILCDYITVSRQVR